MKTKTSTLTHDDCESVITIVHDGDSIFRALVATTTYGPRHGAKITVSALDTAITWESDNFIHVECPDCGYDDSVDLIHEGE